MKISKLILRIHGTILLIATLGLTGLGWMSFCCGTGIYGDMLLKKPIGFIGLFQAYLLMFTIGLWLWMGSYRPYPQKLHWLGIGAHLAPLAANLIFWNEIESYGIPHSGILLHAIMIILESYGALKTKMTFE